VIEEVFICRSWERQDWRIASSRAKIRWIRHRPIDHQHIARLYPKRNNGKREPPPLFFQ